MIELLGRHMSPEQLVSEPFRKTAKSLARNVICLIMFQTMAQDVRQSRAISITEWFGDYESWIKIL